MTTIDKGATYTMAICPLKRVVLKEELKELTGDALSAIILNQFLYWSERRKDFDAFIREERERDKDLNIELTSGWIYKTCDQLADELMDFASPSTLRRRITKLVENEWLDERNNPKYKWDRTLQYRPNIYKIQKDLFELGYVLDRYPLQFKFDTSIVQNEESEKQNEESNKQVEQALPEITTEIPSEKKHDASRISPNGDDSLIGIKIIEPRDIQTEYVEVPLYEKSYEIICPECNHHQPWPKSNRERKKKVTLTCKGCGVIWKVVIDYNTGGRDEYKVPLPRQEWTIILDDAIPNLGNELVCDENECNQFVANWRENPSRVVEKLQWAAKEEWLRHQRLKIVARVNAAYETTTKKELSESQQQQQKGEQQHSNLETIEPDWMKLDVN